MDKNTIAHLAKHLETKEDLLSLLNRIKCEMLAEQGLSEEFCPFTMRQLGFYCNPNNTQPRYKVFYIRKKSGGTRKITAPYNKAFKMLLRCVNILFASVYEPSRYAMGFSEGRSVATNAQVHKGQNYVLNIDLKDFFPSVEQARVWKRIQLPPFNFSQPIANLLAGLCAMKQVDAEGVAQYVLPQGAPTSPIITNMICDKLDRRLGGLAKRFKVNYTRYADDITFSSMHNVYHENGDFRRALERIITDQGFTINEQKTRLQKLGARQEVTGVIVSHKINVPQTYVRDIRNVLYLWSRYGYMCASGKFLEQYRREKGYLKRGKPELYNVLNGKLNYLKMVKGEGDSVYHRLNEKYQSLLAELLDTDKTNKYGITYMETFPLEHFERVNDTIVTIKMSNNVWHPDPFDANYCEEKEPHRYAGFSWGGRKCVASVDKAVMPENEHRKDLLSMSVCRGRDGKIFWLVHLRTKLVKPISRAEDEGRIDIDELDKELDLMLKL